MKVLYNAALYCRLSREDENGSSQSESIKNQINFLTKHVLEQGWNIVDTYIDDGFSGTNFDRPDFKRMIEHIEAGKVNLVITKDLSRLGRDYIGVGTYLERYFPERRIRYIAVNDGVDTLTDSNTNDVTPFKSVINDYYARDISKKVRSIFRNKVASGKFIGAFAPYGYKKDSNDNSRLVIDEVAAASVRRIFRMYIEGKGLTHIAHTLNTDDVPNPSSYKAAEGNYRNGRMLNRLWVHNTVRVILINPTYAGNMAQNKFQKVNYKSKKLLTVDRDNWVVVENTHEPIVSMEDFQLVQNMIHRKSSLNVMSKKVTKLLSGFIFCGDCGEYMTFTKTQKGEEYVVCSKYKRFTAKYCTRHAMKVSDLEGTVMEDIRGMLKSVTNCEDIAREAQVQTRQSRKSSESSISRELASTGHKLEEINNSIRSLYKDKVKGILSESEFIDLNKGFNKEKDVLVYKYNELQGLLDQQTKRDSEAGSILATVKSLVEVQYLSRELLEKLVDKIEVYEDSSIRIFYKFRNPFD